jgi:hypothetical protein
LRKHSFAKISKHKCLGLGIFYTRKAGFRTLLPKLAEDKYFSEILNAAHLVPQRFQIFFVECLEFPNPRYSIALCRFKGEAQPVARFHLLTKLTVVAREIEREQRLVREVVDHVQQQCQCLFDSASRHPPGRARAPHKTLKIIRQQAGQSFGNRESHLVLPCVVNDVPAEFENFRQRALSRAEFLQFLKRTDMITEFKPAFSGTNVLLVVGVQG